MTRNGTYCLRTWCLRALVGAMLFVVLVGFGRLSTALLASVGDDLRRDAVEETEAEDVALPERGARQASPKTGKSPDPGAWSRAAQPRPPVALVADRRPIVPRSPEPISFVSPRPFRLLN